MTAPLSSVMRWNLKHIASHSPHGWVPTRYYNRGELGALERRGLIEFDEGRWRHQVRLTDAGRSAAAELKGAS